MGGCHALGEGGHALGGGGFVEQLVPPFVVPTLAEEKFRRRIDVGIFCGLNQNYAFWMPIMKNKIKK
jgi:hypothetical protein